MILNAKQRSKPRTEWFEIVFSIYDNLEANPIVFGPHVYTEEAKTFGRENDDDYLCRPLKTARSSKG